MSLTVSGGKGAKWRKIDLIWHGSSSARKGLAPHIPTTLNGGIERGYCSHGSAPAASAHSGHAGTGQASHRNFDMIENLVASSQ